MQNFARQLKILRLLKLSREVFLFYKWLVFGTSSVLGSCFGDGIRPGSLRGPLLYIIFLLSTITKLTTLKEPKSGLECAKKGDKSVVAC